MIFHWLTTGWRSLIANPLFSAITIASLSIGCCGALLVGANIKQHLTFERWVPDAPHVFMVTRKQDDSGFYGQGAVRLQAAGGVRPSPSGPYKLAEAIDGKIPGILQTARVARYQSLLPPDPSYPTTPPQPGDPPRTPPPGSVFVDEAFFNMFGLEFVSGSISGLSEPSGVIITQSAARRLFGEASALGQMVEGQNKRQFRVTGVIRDLPPETHLRFEAIGGMRLLRQIMDAEAADNAASMPPGTPPRPSQLESWDGFFATTYIRSTPDVDPRTFVSTAKKTIQAIADERVAASPRFDPFAGAPTATFGGAGAPAPRAPGAGPAASPPAPPPPRPPAAGATSPAGPGALPPPPLPPSLNQGYVYNVVPVLDIHLGGPELTSVNSSGDVKLLTTLGTAALALLAVSAFNYVTLSLARSLRRRREVAVRKVLGASQGTLVVHYIAESAIVTAISLAVGFALAFLLAPWFARMIGQPETLFDLSDPAFLVGTLVAFVFLAFAVGGYPAFYLAHTRPRTALGEGGAASHGRIGQWVTGGLMGLQISAAAALLIVSMTMNAQADYIANRSMGYEVKDRYQVSIPCFVTDLRTPPEKIAQTMTRCRTAMRSVLSQMKDIDKPAYFNGALMTDTVTLQPFGRAAQGEKLGEAARMTVDLTFLETLGSTLLAGRLFDPNSAYDSALTAYNDEMQAAAVTEVRRSGGGISIMTRPPANFKPTHTRPTRVPVVITRALVPMLGVQTPQEAIGMQISNQPNAQYPYEIIGVIEDWNQRPLKYAVHPIIFMPSSSQNAVIRIDKDRVDSVRDEIAQIWKNMSGETTAPSLRPLQQTLEQSYRSDFQLMTAVTSFALVAIIVAGMGVFGLSAFEMRRRVREIGIRKALGASPAKVALLVIGRAVAFAAIATVVAWPIGLLIANEWLSGFVYRTSLGPVVLPIASAAVIAFVAAAVAFSAIRAAAIRPGLALRV